MKKILAYVSPDKYASFFDVIVGYDAGADVVVPYCGISSGDMTDMLHNAVFTRHPKELKNTAVFIGGRDVGKCEELLEKSVDVLEKLPKPFRVSIAADPSGAYTTASACVAKINSALFNIDGLNATVLAGTGPTGRRIGVLLAKEGCNVTVTSRKLEKAQEVCDEIRKRFDVKTKPVEILDITKTGKAISEADIVVSAGSEGIKLLPRDVWMKNKNIRVMADVNAVPPYGIENVDPDDDGRKIDGKIVFGAIALGNLKMKCHVEIIKRMFIDKNHVFDLKSIYKLTKDLL